MQSQGGLPARPRRYTERKPPSPAVLGLDVGMTATRASILALDNGDGDPILIPRADDRQNYGEYQQCDFPSTAYPLDSTKPLAECLGFAAETYAHSLPLKLYWPFIEARELRIRRKPQELKLLKDTFPPVKSLWATLNKREKGRKRPEYHREVLTRLTDIFKEHLRQIKTQVDWNAENKGLVVTTIVATLPPGWHEKTTRKYSDLLMDVWDEISVVDLHWMGECEAVGHWLLRNNDIVVNRMYETERFLLADFGGHTLSTYTFEIVRRPDGEKFSFFSTSDATCTYGGSELHTLWVKSNVQHLIDQNKELSDEDKQFLLTSSLHDYRRYHRAIIKGDVLSLLGRRSNRDMACMEFPFTLDECKDNYEKAFGKPLRHLFAEIERNASISKQTAVVLSGGSFRNKHVRGLTLQKLEQAGLKCIEWTEQVRPAYNDSSAVSAGAALAQANSISVREFMDGAMFAVQDTESTGKDRRVVLDRGQSPQRQRPLVFNLSPGFCSIICAPLSPGEADIGDRGTVTTIPWDRTYHFLDLGKLAEYNGKYTVSLEYEPATSEHPDQLILALRRWQKGTKAVPGPDPYEQILPIYYDPGPCVCFVDVDQLGLGAKAKTMRRIRNAAERPNESRRQRQAEQDEIWAEDQSGPDDDEDLDGAEASHPDPWVDRPGVDGTHGAERLAARPPPEEGTAAVTTPNLARIAEHGLYSTQSHTQENHAMPLVGIQAGAGQAMVQPEVRPVEGMPHGLFLGDGPGESAATIYGSSSRADPVQWNSAVFVVHGQTLAECSVQSPGSSRKRRATSHSQGQPAPPTVRLPENARGSISRPPQTARGPMDR